MNPEPLYSEKSEYKRLSVPLGSKFYEVYKILAAMRNLITILFTLSTLLVIAAPNTDAPSFFERFAPLAQIEMKQNGIPASIKLGQAALESAFGKSQLAVNANNYFGIKCRNAGDCTSKVYKYKDDDKNAAGELIESTFMAFNTPSESFLMHSQFIKGNMNRYGKLFDLDKNDYKAWAKGLQECGYATDPLYAEKLIATIEKYNLQKYDELVLNESRVLAKKKSALDMLDAAALAPQRIPERTIASTQRDTNPTYATAAPQKKSSSVPVMPQNVRMEMKKSNHLHSPSTDRMSEVALKAEMKKTSNVKEYVPEEYKEIFETSDTSEKGTAKSTKRKMMGGNSLPR